MIECKLSIDLPSQETNRTSSLFEWVGSLFGSKPDLRSGQEQLTVSGNSLLEGLYGALRDNGVEDAIALLVDKKVIYHDKEGHRRDLRLMAVAAQESGVMDKNFKEMHLVMSTEHVGLNVLVDVKIRSLNTLGEPEVQILLSGRPEVLTAGKDENPASYAERVRAFAADPHQLEALRLTLDSFAARLADAARRHLPVVHVDHRPAHIQLLRPDKASLTAMNGTQAGEGGASLRDVPARAGRAGGDVYGTYYYDPYWDLTNYLMWSTLLHSHHHTSVVYVDRTGSEVPAGGGDTGGVHVGEGGVSVDSSAIESAPDSGVDWGGSETSDSWGGSDTSDAGGWGGSDTGGDSGWGAGDAGGGDAGGGDAGGGSSCGSSCGGGCGGGGD